jgi:arylsulfatase A-like enzyme
VLLQVGWNDLGYHNELISSPWIDKLALGGVRLTNHHAFKVVSADMLSRPFLSPCWLVG